MSDGLDAGRSLYDRVAALLNATDKDAQPVRGDGELG